MNHALVAFLVLSGALAAQATKTWPQFLGEGATARAVGATSLSFDRKEGLRYQVAIPAGSSSPCILGEQIFLTGYDGKQLMMFALDRATGKEQWRFGVEGPKQLDFGHKDAGVAMPTACANAQHVFFYFPSYGLLCRKLTGELVWEKRLVEGEFVFGCGSSPVLYGENVYLLRDGCPDNKLYALRADTGEEVWSIPRLTFKMSHTTPFFWQNEGGTELIIASSGSVVSYDPANGTEVWRVEGFTPLVCTTPTASRDRLYFAAWSTPSAAGPDRFFAGLEEEIEFTDEQRTDPEKLFARLDGNSDGKIERREMPRGRSLTAFAFLDQNGDSTISKDEWLGLMRFPQQGKNALISIRAGGKGDVTETHIDWTVTRGIPYVSSPLLYDDHIYLIKAGGLLSCVNAKTGKDRFRTSRLGDRSEYYATPVGVDGHVVVCSSAGTIYVLKVADEVEIVKEVRLEEPLFATPAVVDGTVYVRTSEMLYAFGQ